MGMQCDSGTLDCPASTGNQSVTGLAFQPLAVIFYWTNLTANGSAGDSSTGIGFASDSTHESMNFYGCDDNVTTSDCTRSFSNVASIRGCTPGTATVIFAADFISMDSGGFTIHWSTVSSGVDVHWIALGGSSLTNSFVNVFTQNTATGNQSITGVGFQPDFVMFLWNRHIADDGSTNGNTHFGLGAAVSTSSRWALLVRNTSGSANGDSGSIQVADRCLHQMNTANVNINGDADFVSFDSDGFTINWGDAPSDSARIGYLCLKGGSYKLGTFNQETSTGNKATTGIGFKPSALFLTSTNKATPTTASADGRISIGGGVSSSKRATIWSGDVNASALTIDNTTTDNTKIINMSTPGLLGVPTVNAAADLVSLDSDGFTLNWTTVDATVRVLSYIAFGPGNVTTNQSCDSVAVGVAGLSKSNIWARTLASTAVGVAAITKATTFVKSFAPVSVGIATMNKSITPLVKAMVAVGVATMNKSVIPLAKATVSVGVTTFASSKVYLQSFAMTAVGIANVAIGRMFLRTFDNVAVGVSTIVKKVFKTFDNTAVGAVATPDRTFIPGGGGGADPGTTASNRWYSMFRRNRNKQN